MAVEYFIERLKQMLINDVVVAPLFSDEVGKLDSHLRRFKALPKQLRDDEKLKQLIGQFRSAVDKAERAIDDAYFVTQNNPLDDHIILWVPRVRNAVEEIGDVIKKLITYINKKKSSTTDSDNDSYNLFRILDTPIDEIDSDDSDVEDGGTAQINLQEHPIIKQQNVTVGMEDDVEELSRLLMKESIEILQCIPIIGKAGTGKTILAQKIFHDARIVNHFPIRIWVYVSETFTEKEIFLDILKKFTLLTDDIKSKTDDELADLVVGFLENERFLLVLDDLWDHADLDRLERALPRRNRMGRVLITSRGFGLIDAYASRGPHWMRSLTDHESFELLQLEALWGKELPQELEREGRVIANKCNGLPLAIVLIRGILVKEFSSDRRTMITSWKKVFESFNSIIDQGEYLLHKIIQMSYNKLPYHLRECFLYIGMFPEDFEISVWKLIRLWIGEGFIQHMSDVSLEETAENYLQELIDRNLVKGVKYHLNGKVKACRVHDLIHDFCIVEAERDGFFQKFEKWFDGDGVFKPRYNNFYFRLCVHSNLLIFFSKKPIIPGVLSFVYSSREEMDMPMKDLSTIPKDFKLLRVLDVEPINFNLKLPRDLFQLLRLRYLFLSVKFDVLPSAFSQLLNIQTLVFNTSTRTLEIRANILNLTQLRHFKTKASAALPETSTSSLTAIGGESFQTLGNISPESCTKDFFDRAHNLKKLGVRGNLALLLDVEKESFDSLGKLENLEKLKLLNDVFPIPPSGLPVLSLPPPNKFPPNLKILTLSRTCLHWRYMSIIGSLANLEVLKLEDKAFVGDTWEVSDGGFRCLEVLRIERLNLKIWLASDNHFPKLKHLQLRYCDDLRKIPIELADVRNFTKLELFHCKRAAASAREIETKIKQDNVAREFDLSISPFQS